MSVPETNLPPDGRPESSIERAAAKGARALIAMLGKAASEGRLGDMPPGPEGASLGALADPELYVGPIDIQDWDRATLMRMLETMLRIRAVEEALAQAVTDGEIVCPVHLAIGQEAVPTGVSLHLTADDRVFGGHRSHGHYLALGGDVYRLLAEAFGKDDGCSRGMGGSMHLTGAEVGFHGSVPIVAASVPIAVGAALAAKKDGKGAIAVAYFGDGAVEEGGVQESLNLARVLDLPVLFVCENNLYASHMDISQRQPGDRTARFAEAHGIPARVIDGNDVVAVARAAGELIAAARGGGPGYLEAVTYRWRGHVGPDENIDVGLRRSADELAAWRRRDPVARLATAMQERGDLEPDGVEVLRRALDASVAEQLARARNAADPPAQALTDRVYAAPGAR